MRLLPPAIERLLRAAAGRHGVSPSVALAVAWIESRGNVMAESPAGAMGVMQLMESTASTFGMTDPFDAAENVDVGVRFLRKLHDRYGNYRQALAAYNWGPGNVKRKPDEASWPGQVRGYVDKVLARANEETLRGSQGAAPLPRQAQPRPAPPKPPDPHRARTAGAGWGVAALFVLGLGYLALLQRRGAR